MPLSGNQYSEKVSENSIAALKSLGLYTDAEAKAFEKFIEIFKDENFPPGSSIFFGVSASLKVSQLMLISRLSVSYVSLLFT